MVPGRRGGVQPARRAESVGPGPVPMTKRTVMRHTPALRVARPAPALDSPWRRRYTRGRQRPSGGNDEGRVCGSPGPRRAHRRDSRAARPLQAAPGLLRRRPASQRRTRPAAAADGQRAQGDLLRLRHRCRRGRRLARFLWRPGLALRHLTRPVLRRGRHAAAGPAVRTFRHSDLVVHPRPLDRDLPLAMQGGVRRRPRDRPARLFAREPHRDDAQAGRGRARQVHRPDRRAHRPHRQGLCRAMVGVQPGDQRAADQEGHPVRPQPDEPRLHPVLRAGRRSLDADRLFQAGARMDGAAGARRGKPISSTSRRAGTPTICRR